MIELKLVMRALFLNTKRPWVKKSTVRLSRGREYFTLQCDTNKEGQVFCSYLRNLGLTVQYYPYWVEGMMEKQLFSPREIRDIIQYQIPVCYMTAYGRDFEKVIKKLKKSFPDYYLIIEKNEDHILL